MVTSNLRALKNELVLAQFDVSPFYIMVRKGNTALLKEINSAVKELNAQQPLLKDELFRKYYTPETGAGIVYSLEERSFIKECRENGTVFKAIINTDRKPYSYIEGETLSGIFYDITQEIINRTGLQVQIVAPKTRKEYVEQTANPEISIILDMHSDYSVAESARLKLTRPYITVPFYQITKKVRTASAAKAKKAAAETANTPVLPTLAGMDYVPPEKNSRYQYTTLNDCVKALHNGTIDSCVLYELSALQLLFSDSHNSLNIQPSPLPNQDFCIGVSTRENTLVASIFDKASASMSEDFISAAVQKYVQHQPNRVSVQQFLSANVFVLPVIIILLGAFVFTIGFLRFQKQAEHEKNYELNRFLSFVCKANDVVEEIDIAGGRKFTYIDSSNSILKREDFYATVALDAETVHPDDWKTVKDILLPENLLPLIEHAQQRYCECRIRQPDGSWVWFSLIVQGLLPDKQHVCSYMLFRRNINEAKQTELQKQQAVIEAYNVSEKATASKVSFLSQMSHEIRTPLNAITGYVNLAREGQNDTLAVRSYLDKIAVSAEHLLQIINELNRTGLEPVSALNFLLYVISFLTIK